MNDLSVEFLRAALSENSDITPLVLLTLEEPSLEEPARFVLNDSGEDIPSRGNVYVATYFKVNFPPKNSTQQTSARIQIDNVDPTIVASLRGFTEVPKVTIELVSDKNLDRVELTTGGMGFINAEYDALLITGQLGYEDLINRKAPRPAYTPNEFPGLHSG